MGKRFQSNSATDPQAVARRVKPEPLWLRMLARAGVRGVAVSLAIHVLLLLIAAAWFIELPGRGNPRGPAEIELAVVLDSELQQIEAAALDVESPQVPETELESLPEVLELGGPATDLPAIDDDLGDITDSVSGAGTDIEGDLGAEGAGGGSAKFFGVEASGSRFAYVVDVSGSMRGEKLSSTKVELIESIAALLEHVSFYIVFYNSEAYPIGARTKWVEANDTGKRWAVDRVKEVVAQGGTEPAKAFEQLLTMKPRPDVIYFMTDGMFDPGLADMLAAQNRGRAKIPIHCLTFVDDAAQEVMRRIAEESGGTYHHVAGPTP